MTKAHQRENPRRRLTPLWISLSLATHLGVLAMFALFTDAFIEEPEQGASAPIPLFNVDGENAPTKETREASKASSTSTATSSTGVEFAPNGPTSETENSPSHKGAIAEASNRGTSSPDMAYEIGERVPDPVTLSEIDSGILAHEPKRRKDTGRLSHTTPRSPLPIEAPAPRAAREPHREKSPLAALEALVSKMVPLGWKRMAVDFNYAEVMAEATAHTASNPIHASAERVLPGALDVNNADNTASKYPVQVEEALRNDDLLVDPSSIITMGKRKRRIANEYFDIIHEQRIHFQFARGFLEGLNELPLRDPLNDRHLHTELTFEILTDGTVGRIRVISSSGNRDFDAGAIASVFDSAPFPEPPKAILSYDDKVYVNWGFHRDQRKCGVFNAEPYVIENAGTRIVLQGAPDHRHSW